MSYSLRLWTKNKIEGCSIPLKEGHIVHVDKNNVADPEDMPTEVLLSISGIKYLTHIDIEPFPSDSTYIKKVHGYVKRLAREYIGILEDPQSGLVYTPSGVKKASLPPIAKNEHTISMSWYMDSKYPLKDKLSEFVDLLIKYMPNALPRRYGRFEPPKYKLDEMGIEHFKDFLINEDSVVWYPNKPVMHVFKSEAYGKGEHRLGYRCNRIELEISKNSYELENWNYTAKRLFKKAAMLLKPFYAEIISSEMSRICSWWWKGLPEKMGDTIIIGEPYSLMLRSVHKYESISENLFYIDNEGVSARKKFSMFNKKFFAKTVKPQRTASQYGHRLYSSHDYDYAKQFPFKVLED